MTCGILYAVDVLVIQLNLVISPLVKPPNSPLATCGRGTDFLQCILPLSRHPRHSPSPRPGRYHSALGQCSVTSTCRHRLRGHQPTAGCPALVHLLSCHAITLSVSPDWPVTVCCVPEMLPAGEPIQLHALIAAAFSSVLGWVIQLLLQLQSLPLLGQWCHAHCANLFGRLSQSLNIAQRRMTVTVDSDLPTCECLHTGDGHVATWPAEQTAGPWLIHTTLVKSPPSPLTII